MAVVSIGIPVFNGARYLGEAIGSVQSQTFQDFEVIITDNASTDSTPDIANAFATRDSRIRYSRNPTNLGAYENHNRAAQQATAKYYKSLSCDDICAPTYLEKCIAALEEDPSAVLCHSRTALIDNEGRSLVYDPALQLFVDSQRTFAVPVPDPNYADSDDPVVRFRGAVLRTVTCQHVMGIMRTDVMRRYFPMARYYGADRALLIRLALHGRFREVPEELFFKRQHAGGSRMIATASQKAIWSGAPAWAGTFDVVRGYLDISRGVLRSDLRFGQKARCLRFAAYKAILARAGQPIAPHVQGVYRPDHPFDAADPALPET